MLTRRITNAVRMPACPQRVVAGLLLMGLALPTSVTAQTVEWRAYGADIEGTKYSPLNQIDADNFNDLAIVWRESVLPDAVRGDRDVSASLAAQNTPLMADGQLYISSGFGTIAALDARTGELLWHDMPPDRDGEPFQRVRQTRGVAYWEDPSGDDTRVIGVVGSFLVAANAATGERYPRFGDDGEVDLRKGYDYGVMETFSWGSPPIVVKDVIIIGSSIQDVTNANAPALKEMPPGDVRGFDVRTGEQLWSFHSIPRPGEVGNETWLTALDQDQPSWEYSGNTNMWAWASADEELGYVYVPLSTPTNDYYGGYRPGDNLFAEAIVCLDARTGERIWHFQAVHHGIWDYDFPAAPNVVDIHVDGRSIQAVAAVSKQAFTYVFDRVTGEPVWPIEERPVAPGDVPGEWYSPTQPFPTKPPPFDQQGTSVDDLIDFTPELRQEALAIFERHVSGPLFTPPSLIDDGPDRNHGTLQMPGVVGGADWGGAAFDPDEGVLYVPSVHSESVIGITESEHPSSDMRLVANSITAVEGPQELPLFKPPYGRLVAIDLNEGEILWSVANGGGPRNHPALRDIPLPWLGQPGRVSPLVTKSLVLLGEGGNTGVPVLRSIWGGAGGKKLRAYDKATGAIVGEVDLPGGTTAAPMTYMLDGRQFILVTVGWDDLPSEYVALALPEAE